MNKTAFFFTSAGELTQRGVPHVRPDLERFVDGAWPRIEENPDVTRWAEEDAQLALWEIVRVGVGRCLGMVNDALGISSGRRGRPSAKPSFRHFPIYPPYIAILSRCGRPSSTIPVNSSRRAGRPGRGLPPWSNGYGTHADQR